MMSLGQYLWWRCVFYSHTTPLLSQSLMYPWGWVAAPNWHDTVGVDLCEADAAVVVVHG